MANYNKVLLMGNITRDIELRALPSGNSVATIGLAVNRKWRDQQSGEMKEDVTFVDCEAFGKTAENISKFFAKGKPIFLEGRLKLDTWQDKTDGSKRSKLKVVVEGFEFIESRGGGGQGAGGESAPRATVRPATGAARPAAAASQPAYEEIQSDDIPF
jgi:single-strand DNA-binding protein